MPKIKTTKAEALSDINNGINNEKWFKYNGAYVVLFRLTAVGVVHSYDEYIAIRGKLDKCVL